MLPVYFCQFSLKTGKIFVSVQSIHYFIVEFDRFFRVCAYLTHVSSASSAIPNNTIKTKTATK